MNLIGTRRAIIFFFLLGLNVVLGAAYMMWLSPEREQAQRLLINLGAEISDLQQKTQDVKKEVALFHENLPSYEKIKKQGFMLPQDRLQLDKDLKGVKGKSALAGFTYSVEDIDTIDNQDAASADMDLINSEIKINGITTFFDSDIYGFLDLMNSEFPAHVRLKSLSIQKPYPLDSGMLERVRKKENVSLITANIVMNWSTIVTKTHSETEGASQP